MVLTQVVMVAIMTMTPIHMKHHGHGLSAVGMVIGIHVAAMFLPSLVTGVLVDKVGRTFMSCAAGVTLLLAGLLAAWAPADSMVWLIVALALLGLGWNFGLISGTAQIIDATSPATRAKTQGTVDVLVSLAGASGGAVVGHGRRPFQLCHPLFGGRIPIPAADPGYDLVASEGSVDRSKREEISTAI